MQTNNELWAARAAEASAHAKAVADAVTGEEEQEEEDIVHAPLLRDDYNRILTRVPRALGPSAGHYLPKKPGPRVVPVSLTGGTPGHGEGGIDGKPVPVDTWGIRGALKGKAGMPKPVPAEKFQAHKIHEHATQNLIPDDHTPFPGLTEGGHVERSEFRRHAETMPFHRLKGRAHETRDQTARTSISAKASYLDKDKRDNAASIRLLEQARAEYNAKKATREAGPGAKSVQWKERGSQRGTVPDLVAAHGHGPAVVNSGRRGHVTSGAAHYELQGVGILLQERHMAAGPGVLVNRHAGTERREQVELMTVDETRTVRQVLVARVVSGTSADKALSPSVAPGDELLRIDGDDVTMLPLQVINALILGIPGTQVTLLFQRSLSTASRNRSKGRDHASDQKATNRNRPADEPVAVQREEALFSDSSDSSDVHPDDDLHHTYQVRLMRGSAEYLAVLDSSQRLLDEYSQQQQTLDQVKRQREHDAGAILDLREEAQALQLSLSSERHAWNAREHATKTGAAVTAGELAYGARVRALEDSIETLNATVRQQARDLDRVQREKNELESELAASRAQHGAMRGLIGDAAKRLQETLRPSQVALAPEHPENGPEALARLTSAHAVMLSNVQSPFLQYPTPMQLPVTFRFPPSSPPPAFHPPLPPTSVQPHTGVGPGGYFNVSSSQQVDASQWQRHASDYAGNLNPQQRPGHSSVPVHTVDPPQTPPLRSPSGLQWQAAGRNPNLNTDRAGGEAQGSNLSGPGPRKLEREGHRQSELEGEGAGGPGWRGEEDVQDERRQKRAGASGTGRGDTRRTSLNLKSGLGGERVLLEAAEAAESYKDWEERLERMLDQPYGPGPGGRGGSLSSAAGESGPVTRTESLAEGSTPGQRLASLAEGLDWLAGKTVTSVS